MSTNNADEPTGVNEWVSQAEAARLRSVSRQAISKLVRNGRLRTLGIGGRLLVHRGDLLAFQPSPPGRRKRGADGA